MVEKIDKTHKHIRYYSREMETILKSQMEILGIVGLLELNNSFDRLISRADMVEEKEDRDSQ